MLSVKLKGVLLHQMKHDVGRNSWCLENSNIMTNQSRVSHHSVRMRENGAEVCPKQTSLDRSF